MRLENEDEKIRDISPSQVRIPSTLKDKLKESAKASKRSFNTEIVIRLESTFEFFGKSSDDKKEIIESIREQLHKLDIEHLGLVHALVNALIKRS